MQDQKLGPGIFFMRVYTVALTQQNCRMIGHCNKTTWNIGLKLQKAPLLHICSSHTELYCLDRSGENRLFFISKKA